MVFAAFKILTDCCLGYQFVPSWYTTIPIQRCTHTC